MYFAGARCVFLGAAVMLLALLALSEASIGGVRCDDPKNCTAVTTTQSKALLQLRMLNGTRSAGSGVRDGIVQAESPNPEFNCTEGEVANWNEEKVAWCCKNELVGCGFNCSAGYSKWQQGWSTLKKDYCCKNELLGCTFNCSRELSNRSLAWPSIKKAWCCKTERMGCEDKRPCLTQNDTLAVGSLLRGYVAPQGTPCMFGLDDRDEGFHCILDGGSYGAFGWCYTAKDRSRWGACNEDCPLFGPDKKIGDRLKKMKKQLLAPAQKVDDTLRNILKRLNGPLMSGSGSSANVTTGGNNSEAKSDAGNVTEARGHAGNVTEGAKKGDDKMGSKKDEKKDVKNGTKADAKNDTRKDGKKG